MQKAREETFLREAQRRGEMEWRIILHMIECNQKECYPWHIKETFNAENKKISISEGKSEMTETLYHSQIDQSITSLKRVGYIVGRHADPEKVTSRDILSLTRKGIAAAVVMKNISFSKLEEQEPELFYGTSPENSELGPMRKYFAGMKRVALDQYDLLMRQSTKYSLEHNLYDRNGEAIELEAAQLIRMERTVSDMFHKDPGFNEIAYQKFLKLQGSHEFAIELGAKKKHIREFADAVKKLESRFPD